MRTSPIYFRWEGDSFVPSSGIARRLCDERFTVGEVYPLEEVHARSNASQGHYFAVLNQIWQSLPDKFASDFPTAEKLRKTALIKTGFHTKTQHVCKSNAEAIRLASMVRPYDEYQIVLVEGVVVSVYKAMSQDHVAMDRKQFQASKEAVLNWCADLVGVDRAAADQSESA